MKSYVFFSKTNKKNITVDDDYKSNKAKSLQLRNTKIFDQPSNKIVLPQGEKLFLKNITMRRKQTRNEWDFSILDNLNRLESAIHLIILLFFLMQYIYFQVIY